MKDQSRNKAKDVLSDYWKSNRETEKANAEALKKQQAGQTEQEKKRWKFSERRGRPHRRCGGAWGVGPRARRSLFRPLLRGRGRGHAPGAFRVPVRHEGGAAGRAPRGLCAAVGRLCPLLPRRRSGEAPILTKRYPTE